VTSFDLYMPLVEGADSVIGDITDLARLKQAMPGHEVVVHLAGVTGPGRAAPEKLMYTNLIGTMHVLEAAVEAGAKNVVFASSGSATGYSFQRHEIVPRYLPIDENHPAEPQDEYGLSKLLAELTCKRYSLAFGIRTICLRINQVWYVDREGASIAVKCSGWGRGLSVEELWTRRNRKCLLEPEGEWPIPGPAPPRNILWGVVDARDVAQAFRLAVEDQNLLHEVFAINGYDTCSLVPTRELIARYYPQVPVRAALDGFASLVSCEKATRLLGYRPQYSWRVSDFRNWLEATAPKASVGNSSA
jgi:nucleoside-diphosphate-sugar epimerase